ncbi:MAG TPA: CPBP family intramembrane glutamic endopeptidase [Gemmataceae bacterium]|nr:CPBP family intramembrane glutamic endopeptidase [Gemmataceae bacterium]
MVNVPPSAEQSPLEGLLRGTGADLVAVLALGALLWVPVLLSRALLAGADVPWRLVVLCVLIGNQLGCLAVAWWRHQLRPIRQSPSAVWGRRRALLMGLAAALALACAGLLYDRLLRRFFGSGAPTLGPWGAVRDLGPQLAVLVLLMGTLVGPVGEEWFFRGTIFGRWADGGWPWCGAALSALVFAAARLDEVNFVAYLGIGLVLAALYRRGGSLVAPVAAQVFLAAMMFALLFSGYH